MAYLKIFFMANYGNTGTSVDDELDTYILNSTNDEQAIVRLGPNTSDGGWSDHWLCPPLNVLGRDGCLEGVDLVGKMMTGTGIEDRRLPHCLGLS
jgi:hypothetical protein